MLEVVKDESRDEAFIVANGGSDEHSISGAVFL